MMDYVDAFVVVLAGLYAAVMLAVTVIKEFIN